MGGGVEDGDMDRSLIALLCLLAGPAFAQTNCPSVSDGARILPIAITGAPRPTWGGSYDLNTSYLWIAWQGTTDPNWMLTSVPQSLIVGHQTVAWASISRYPKAIMQQNSVCPLLAATNMPLLLQ